MRNSILAALAVAVLTLGCDNPSSDQVQHDQQERILMGATAQVGMPAIKNFQERRWLKDILEMRDQGNLVTYTYIENEMPKVTPGVTSLGGKLTFLGNSVGYGIPYATQYTNPQQIEWRSNGGSASGVTSQADPNGLFSPASAEGTWVLLAPPEGGDAKPAYIEPRIAVFTYKLPEDH